MKLFFIQATLFLFCSFGFSGDQMVLVLASSWKTSYAKMQLFEKHRGQWQPVSEVIDVLIGRNGLGWGLGLHKKQKKGPRKQEGDGRSPAGIFKISKACGKIESFTVKMPYVLLHPDSVAVDDPESQYYNMLIDQKNVEKDWTSQEMMFDFVEYRLALFVDHNFPVLDRYSGSCIFIHDWKTHDHPTAGCTALPPQEMTHLVSWLDPQKEPILVQLPIDEYMKLQKKWFLPDTDILLDERR